MEIELFYQKIKRYIPTCSKEELKEISTLATKEYIKKETIAMSEPCCAPIAPMPYIPAPISLACCTAKAYPTVSVGSTKKDDPTMLNSTADLEIQQRNFLKTRVQELEMTKRSEARKAFNIDYVFTPKTKEEFLEALKTATIADDYNYFDKAGNNKYSYDARTLLNSVRVTDGTKIDREGYDAAKAKLADAIRDLKDVITVKPLTEAVEAFETFKKATFH